MSDWDTFEHNLFLTLRDLRKHTFVVITGPGPFAMVQCVLDNNRHGILALTVEVHPPADTARPMTQWLIDAGFTQPDMNLAKDLPWPVPGTMLQQVARAFRTALQWAEVPTPSDLRFTAWRDPEPWPSPVMTGDQIQALDQGDPQVTILGFSPDQRM